MIGRNVDVGARVTRGEALARVDPANVALLIATALTLIFLPALYAAWFRVQPHCAGMSAERRSAAIHGERMQNAVPVT